MPIEQKLFDLIVRIRSIETVLKDFYPLGKIRCPMHLSIGQEAVAAGAGLALDPSDKALSGHRAHAHYLAVGGNLTDMFLEMLGKDGCSHGWGGSMHMSDAQCGFIASNPIVGSTLPIAAGVAQAMQLRGQTSVVAAFLGDAVTETGVFFETLNYASLKSLPIIFICEDNMFSVYSPKSVRLSPRRNWEGLINGLGVDFRAVDGQDGLAVYEAVREARSRAVDFGPQFIYAPTYRYVEHCGYQVDDHLGYRDDAVTQEFLDRDPVIIASRHCSSGEEVQAVLDRNYKAIWSLLESLVLEPDLDESDLSLLCDSRTRASHDAK